MNKEIKNNTSENKESKNIDDKKEDDSKNLFNRFIGSKVARRLMLFVLAFIVIFAFTRMNMEKDFDKIDKDMESESVMDSRYPDRKDLNHPEDMLDKYAKTKAKKLLSDKGFVPNKNDIYINHYQYTPKEFKKLGKLNNVEVYSLYKFLDETTFNKIMVANGYTNYDDYLIKNDYVYENGQANQDAFTNDCWKVLDKEMTVD